MRRPSGLCTLLPEITTFAPSLVCTHDVECYFTAAFSAIPALVFVPVRFGQFALLSCR